MTVAVAKALMDGGSEDDFINAMKHFGRMYPDAGYGGRFSSWLRSDDRRPYNSWGNGSAMRLSPVGFLTRIYNWPPDIDWTLLGANVTGYAERSAAVTHNHPEGIKGAQAVAEAIMYMRVGREVENDVEERRGKLKDFIEDRYGYDLNRSLDEIRPSYTFDVSCQGSVPEAIIAFLESTGFEYAIRNAISIGGDSDTIAAITSGIAQAAYGVPDAIREEALGFLDEPLLKVVLEA
jgi:ADP-ribosylglycohydrolase